MGGAALPGSAPAGRGCAHYMASSSECGQADRGTRTVLVGVQAN